VSIGVTPDPATDGENVTITGTLTGASTDASQTVTLWEMPGGQSAFTQAASTQTDASGAYKFVLAAQTNAAWYVKSAGAVSATMEESVAAAIAFHVAGFAPTGGKVTLTGSVSPSHAGERVALQRRRGSHWVTVARPMLGASSQFTAVVKVRTNSSARFRVVLAADARNARSVSSALTVASTT
jgi:hypothetical protein